MIRVKELFKSHKYPEWISSNEIFTKIEYVRKIFPTIGLPNFEEKIIVDNSKEIIVYANQVLDIIADYIGTRTQKLLIFAKKAKIGKKRRENLDFLSSVMSSLTKQLRNNKAAFISVLPNGKVSLNIPENIAYKDKIFMKKGAGLFKIFEKINTLLLENKFLSLPSLSSTYQFKSFSSINIPAKETIVKFSSEGADGIWDIATMSMRGVNSCQTWDQGVGGNSLKLVGSMIDPFTGIIYLTTGETFNQYGSRMVRRCIVRYVINNETKEPFILLEKMYPAFDDPSLNTFINTIKSRVKNIPIHYSGHIGTRANYVNSKLAQVYVPLSDELKMLDPKYYPYCDSALSFREDATCKLAKNTTALHMLFKRRMPIIFQKAIKSKAFTKVNVKKYGLLASQLMTQLRAKKTEKSTVNIAPVQDLSNKFIEFVCNKTEDGDPFQFLLDHEKECKEFFMSEFGNKTSKEFAEFVALNVFTYIDESSK